MGLTLDSESEKKKKIVDEDEDDEEEEEEEERPKKKSKIEKKKKKKKSKDDDSDDEPDLIDDLSGDEVDTTNIIEGGRASRSTRPVFAKQMYATANMDDESEDDE